MTYVYGYDGTAYKAGDRVELHPATDLWMRGARFGTVSRISLTPKDRVTVSVDRLGGRKFSGTADTFRLAQPVGLYVNYSRKGVTVHVAVETAEGPTVLACGSRPWRGGVGQRVEFGKAEVTCSRCAKRLATP